MNLSILIPTVGPRTLYLNRLLCSLEEQVVRNNLRDKIEVVIFKDNFENSIGFKRNKLLKAASGKFTCFVDDDDLVHTEYCKIMTDTIEKNPDIQHIGFKLKYFHNGLRGKDAFHSLQYKGWYETPAGYFRETTTSNPIRSDISKQFKFPDKNNQEDKDWVTQIIESRLLQKEHFIDDYMYEYYSHDLISLSADRKNRNQGNQSLPWFPKEITGLNIIQI